MHHAIISLFFLIDKNCSDNIHFQNYSYFTKNKKIQIQIKNTNTYTYWQNQDQSNRKFIQLRNKEVVITLYHIYTCFIANSLEQAPHIMVCTWVNPLGATWKMIRNSCWQINYQRIIKLAESKTNKEHPPTHTHPPVHITQSCSNKLF